MDRQDIETRARELFDESVEGIDYATRSRLNQARQAALAELGRPRRRLAAWLPAAAVATVAAAAVMLQMSQVGWTPRDTGGTPVVAEDFELLTLGEDLDMLDEDAEFYAWAAAAAAVNGQG